MNLIYLTKKNLQSNIDRLNDLEECLNKDLSVDAVRYCRDEIVKIKVNIEYYSKILEVLENRECELKK